VRRLGAAAAAVLAAWAGAARAECPPGAGDCQALLETGAPGGRVDFVIVGDGYTAAERDAFYADAAAVAESLRTASTYASYAPVFNVWALFVPSPESGADDPMTGADVDTAFDATFGYQGIDYLIGISTGGVLGEINDRFPEFDVPMCLVNAPKYGGSGGTIAVVSSHPDAVRIMEHELGHSFAGLADEYEVPYPGYPPGDSEPNVAALENLDPLKWSPWVTPGTPIPTPIASATSLYEPIGAYEGARYLTEDIFRPAPNCRMRELGREFCPVCAEAMVLGFAELRALIDETSPPDGTAIPAVGPSPLSVTVPELADLDFVWSVDGVITSWDGSVLPLDPAVLQLADGPHTVSVTVRDETALVRSDPEGLLEETATWTVVVDSSLPPVGGAGGGGEGGAPPDEDPPAEDDADEDGCSCGSAGGPASSTGALAGLVALVGLFNARGRLRRRSAGSRSCPRRSR